MPKMGGQEQQKQTIKKNKGSLSGHMIYCKLPGNETPTDDKEIPMRKNTHLKPTLIQNELFSSQLCKGFMVTGIREGKI